MAQKSSDFPALMVVVDCKVFSLKHLQPLTLRQSIQSFIIWLISPSRRRFIHPFVLLNIPRRTPFETTKAAWTSGKFAGGDARGQMDGLAASRQDRDALTRVSGGVIGIRFTRGKPGRFGG